MENIKRKSIPKVLKDKVWNIYIGVDNGVGECYCCQEVIDSKHFEAGHIVSCKNGGETNVKNLRPICDRCNKSISTDNMDDFIDKYGLNSELEIEPVEKPKINFKSTNKKSKKSSYYYCHICSKDYSSSKSLWEHNKKYHGTIETIEQHIKMSFICGYCNKKLKNNFTLKRHLCTCKKNPNNRKKTEANTTTTIEQYQQLLLEQTKQNNNLMNIIRSSNQTHIGDAVGRDNIKDNKIEVIINTK